ncbi:MAG: hypothetical protein K2N53_02965 [Clostridia bacterium]|nr:hypothetical protein [Clostridia bacterium]
MKIKRTAVAVVSLLCLSIFACALLGCVSNTSTEYDVVKQTKKDNFTLLNENYAQQNQTVFIGDSIIEIYNTELFDGVLDTKVYNRGISGDTSDKLLERLQDNALNIAPQNLVTLVGTNDLSRKISADTVCDNISKVVDKSIESGVENIVVCSLLPVNKSINGKMVGIRNNKDIRQLNSMLKDMCQQKQVVFVDLYTLLEDGDGNFDKQYTYDGLHPNAQGYVVITQALEKVLR